MSLSIDSGSANGQGRRQPHFAVIHYMGRLCIKNKSFFRSFSGSPSYPIKKRRFIDFIAIFNDTLLLLWIIECRTSTLRLISRRFREYISHMVIIDNFRPNRTFRSYSCMYCYEFVYTDIRIVLY